LQRISVLQTLVDGRPVHLAEKRAAG
jgi:hypothetical protein